MKPRLLTLLVVSLLLSLRALTAWAQTSSASEDVARRKLIDRAKLAAKAGEHNTALELAERAAAIQMTPSLRSFLAAELEATGKLTESLDSAQKCVREFERDPSLLNRDEYLALCRDVRDRVEKRVGHLVLKLDPLPASAVVKVGDRVVNPALIGERYPVTPGPIKVEASAPGYYPFRTEITVASGPDFEVKITLTAAPASACPAGQIRGADGACVDSGCGVGFYRRGAECLPGAAPVAPGGESSSLTIEVTRSQQPPAKPFASRRLGTALAIVGGVALVASVVTWGIAQSKFTSIRDKCDRNECTDSEAATGRDEVRTLDRITVATAIGGGTLLSAGAVIFFAGRW